VPSKLTSVRNLIGLCWSRDKPIITLIEGIKHYLTKRIANHKEIIQRYKGNICPMIQQVLEKTKKEAEKWTFT
jgi:hypothetical protein